jgi:hypothetical protein
MQFVAPQLCERPREIGRLPDADGSGLATKAGAWGLQKAFA